MAGRDRTCDAPRFRRALYRLSYGHASGRRLESNQRPLVCKTSALPAELLAQELRDKDSNLDLHVQSVVSCPLDDPGSAERRRSASPSISRSGDRRSSGCSRRVASSVSPGAACRTMFSMPLAYPSTLDRPAAVAQPACRTSYVEELWSPSLARSRENAQAKAHAYSQRYFQRDDAEGLSLSGGASIRSRFCSSWASPLRVRLSCSPPKRRRRPVGSPSLELLCG